MKPQILIYPLLLVLMMLCNNNVKAQAVVIDTEHNETSFIESIVKNISNFLKNKAVNYLDKISKVQEFLKKAAHLVSAVVRNMKMTRDLVAEEAKLRDLYEQYFYKLEGAGYFPNKTEHWWVLYKLFLESVRVFEVFDLATQQNMGVIDDKGRILLIKGVLREVRQIKSAMRIGMRRTNRAIFEHRRRTKELEVFTNLFGTN